MVEGNIFALKMVDYMYFLRFVYSNLSLAY